MISSRGLIKVVSNFITKDEASNLISFIDNNLQNHRSYQEGMRYAWKFGKDFYFDYSEKDFSKVGNIENYFREIIFKKTIKILGDLYQAKDVSVSNLWFSKHEPGSVVPIHQDIDDGFNPQFQYSAILYLNSLDNTGILKFPFSDFMYTPKEGDLILFPSKGKEFSHEVDEIKQTRYSVPMWISAPEYSL